MGYTQNEKQYFLAEITKAQADHQLSETFYFIKISYVLAELCMNLFVFCVMFFIKKGSFPAKTALSEK